MRALRPILILAGVLALLVVAALVAARVLFEPETYRPRIEAFVGEALQRPFELRGPLRLQVFPWLGLEAEGVRLGNPEGFPPSEAPLLEARRMALRVRLLPLLRREVEVGTVELDGVRLNLVRLGDGRSNFEGLGAGGGPRPDREGGEDAAKGGGAAPPVAALAVGGLVVRDAAVRFRDLRAGRELALSGLELEVGAFRPGEAFPVRAEGAFRLVRPALEGTARLRARVRADLAEGAHAVRGLALRVRAKGDGLPPAGLELEVEGGGALEPGADRLVLEPVRLRLAGVEALLTDARVERLASAPRLVGGLAVAPFDPRGTLMGLGIEPPKTADPRTFVHLELRTRLWASASAVELKRLRLVLDETTAEGELAVRGLDGSRPRYLASLRVDRLDLDRYLPPRAKAGARGASPGGAAAAGALLPVGTLRALRASAELAVGELRAWGIRSREVTLRLEAEGGRLRLHPARARLYGGRYRGDVRIDARGPVPVVRVDERLEGVRLQPLLRDLMGFERLSGTGTVRARLAARGADPVALRRTLSGEIAVALRDGAIEGVNVAALLREARARLRGEPAPAERGPRRTDFTEITATGRVRDGVLRNDDLLGKSPFLRVTGRGTVDLVRERLDYRLRAVVVSTAKGQGGEGLEELEGVPVPLRLRGPLASPEVTLDVEALLKETQKKRLRKKLEKKRRKLEERLRRRLEKELGDGLGRDLEERLRGLLR